MFGLYQNPLTAGQEKDITPPTMEDTFRGILSSHAEGGINRDIELTSFSDFLTATEYLVANSERIKMILDADSFRSIVDYCGIKALPFESISRDHIFNLDIFGDYIPHLEQRVRGNIVQGPASVKYDIHPEIEGTRKIVIGDTKKLVFLGSSDIGIANFNYPEGVSQLLNENAQN